MKQIEVISQELALPAVVSGCMRISEMPVGQVERLVFAAMECGVTMFDHADIYGGGQSETVFGQVLSRNPGLREKMVLQSKCGIGAGLYNASKDHILAATDGILSRLGIAQLDVLLLHRPDALMEPEEVAAAFDTLQRAGKVKYFGVSNQNAAQMRLLQKVMPMKLRFNQLQFSLMQSGIVDAGINVNTGFDGAVERAGGVLEHCQAEGITIQTWSPLQYGFFEGVFVDNPKFPELNAALAEIGQEVGLSPAAVAVAWILRHPANMQVVLGTTNEQRLKDMSAAAGVRLTHEQWYRLYRAAGHTLP